MRDYNVIEVEIETLRAQLRPLYKAMLRIMQDEISFGHQDPMFKALQADADAIVEQIHALYLERDEALPNAAFIATMGRSLHDFYKAMHPINHETVVREWLGTLTARVYYAAPPDPEVYLSSAERPMVPMPTNKFAQFENFYTDSGMKVFILAFAPAINTVYWRRL